MVTVLGFFVLGGPVPAGGRRGVLAAGDVVHGGDFG